MTDPGLGDAALVIACHGSTLNAESSAPAYQHADELRRRGLFREVIECFWKLEPSISSVRRLVSSPRVFVVPLFISEGYFTDEVLPRELGMPRRSDGAYERRWDAPGRSWRYCGPVGTHASMTAVLLARAQAIVRKHPVDPPLPPSEISLFIVGHGTGNNDQSRLAIEAQADLIRARSMYREVQAVFMEEDPRVEGCIERAAAPGVVIVPFFISDGLHSFEDIPVLLGEPREAVTARYRAGELTWTNPSRRAGRWVWYTPSIGSEPHLADVILERVRQADLP